ncbi:GNAT family N-acetyltransferase [Rhizobium sp.]|uniref:GNAT family N-acetyltransferase n=1 Tax=Rhizobium sp. TaxID=391 RepID=UPI002AA65468
MILTLELYSALEPLESEWRALERDDYCSLHQSYDWCQAWATTHANPLAIVRGQQQGRTVMILPLEISRTAMVRSASFIGARFSNINTGLFDPTWRQTLSTTSLQLWSEKWEPVFGKIRCENKNLEHRANSNFRHDALGALRQQIASLLKPQADVLHLGNIPLHWRGEQHPLAGWPCVEHQNHAFQLPLFADFPATLAQLNAKRRRKKFKNQHRKLEERGGYEHIIAHGDDEKAQLLATFFRQKAVRFAALGLPDVFQSPQTQGFFHHLLKGHHDRLNMPLELHAIRLRDPQGGKIAAIAGLSRKGTHVICQFGSIDATLAPEASPGELLFWLMIEQCCKDGVTLFDFGLGDQGYKRGWCPVETVQHDIIQPLTPLGHIAAKAQRVVIRTKAAIKNNRQAYGFIQRMRAKANRASGKDSGESAD